jgi:hypothetical protein
MSTSYLERQNLNLRMGVRRFTRLTSASQRSSRTTLTWLRSTMPNYNFCRVHQTLRWTPAIEAGLANHVWNLSELVGLLEASTGKS